MKQRKDGRWAKKITIKGKQIFFYSTEATEKKAEKDIQRQMLEYKERTAPDKKLFGGCCS